MEQLISRLIIILIWISLPLLLLFNAPIKFVVFITIVWLFMLYSHICNALIHRHLIPLSAPRPASWPALWPAFWTATLKILIFGPLEIDHLKKQQQKSLIAE